MSGIWNMSIWNVILHKTEGTGLAFLLRWRLHILVISPHLWKKVCLQRKYYVYMTLTQLALSASMFHAFWLVNPYKIQRDRPSFSTNPRLRTNSPACAETCALDSYTVRKWHRPNLLNCTKNTENFGFYRHDNFFYQFGKKGTRPKDDWNNFLSRPYQNLLVSDDRTSAKVRPWATVHYNGLDHNRVRQTSHTRWMASQQGTIFSRTINLQQEVQEAFPCAFLGLLL